MFVTRALVGLILSLVFTLGAEAGDKAKKKKSKPVRGVVTAVTRDGDATTLAVRVGKKKAGTTTEKKFKLAKNATIEKVSGKKGGVEKKPATLADVTPKSHVSITTEKGKDVAQKVQIASKKKKG